MRGEFTLINIIRYKRAAQKEFKYFYHFSLLIIVILTLMTNIGLYSNSSLFITISLAIISLKLYISQGHVMLNEQKNLISFGVTRSKYFLSVLFCLLLDSIIIIIFSYIYVLIFTYFKLGYLENLGIVPILYIVFYLIIYFLFLVPLNFHSHYKGNSKEAGNGWVFGLGMSPIIRNLMNRKMMNLDENMIIMNQLKVIKITGIMLFIVILISMYSYNKKDLYTE